MELKVLSFIDWYFNEWDFKILFKSVSPACIF